MAISLDKNIEEKFYSPPEEIELVSFKTEKILVKSESTFGPTATWGESTRGGTRGGGTRFEERKTKIGKAHFGWRICKTPDESIKKVLIASGIIDTYPKEAKKQKGRKKDKVEVSQAEIDAYRTFSQKQLQNDFYTAFLDLSITFDKPDRQKLVKGTFSIGFDPESVRILNIAPSCQGIKMQIKDTRVRTIKFTGSAELAAQSTGSMSVTDSSSKSPSSSKTKTVSTQGTESDSSTETSLVQGQESTVGKELKKASEFKIGPSLKFGGEYDKQKTYEMTFEDKIEDVKGAIQRTNSRTQAYWEVYPDVTRQPMDTLEVRMIHVPAIVNFAVKKIKKGNNWESQYIQAKLDAGGQATEEKYMIFNTSGQIELVGENVINLKDALW